jgi:hypothetical protein
MKNAASLTSSYNNIHLRKVTGQFSEKSHNSISSGVRSYDAKSTGEVYPWQSMIRKMPFLRAIAFIWQALLASPRSGQERSGASYKSEMQASRSKRLVVQQKAEDIGNGAKDLSAIRKQIKPEDATLSPNPDLRVDRRRLGCGLKSDVIVHDCPRIPCQTRLQLTRENTRVGQSWAKRTPTSPTSP